MNMAKKYKQLIRKMTWMEATIIVVGTMLFAIAIIRFVSGEWLNGAACLLYIWVIFRFWFLIRKNRILQCYIEILEGERARNEEIISTYKKMAAAYDKAIAARDDMLENHRKIDLNNQVIISNLEKMNKNLERELLSREGFIPSEGGGE